MVTAVTTVRRPMPLPDRTSNSRSQDVSDTAFWSAQVHGHRFGVSLGLVVLIGVVTASGALAPTNAVAEVNLAAEVTAGYTNNLLRIPGGDDEAPASLGLTGTWIETTRHLSADVKGRVDGILYLKDTFDDEVVGQVDGSLTWWAVPERFAWAIEDDYGQVTTDPFAPISPENRQNTNYFSTGPDWYIPFGDRMRGYLGGRYDAVRYEIDDSDSDRLIAMVGFDRAVSSASRLGVQASTESVDYDSELHSDFDRRAAYAHYEFSREQATGMTQSGLTVNVGYTWLEGDAGDHSAPLLEVLYSKALSSSVRVGLELASRFSDAGREFAAGGLPGSDPGSDPGVIPQAGVYEEKSGLATVDYQRQRTTVSLAVGLADQIYETATLDRRRYNSNLSVERRMTRRLTGIAGVHWSRDEYESGGLDREDTDIAYRLELRRELGPRTSLAVVGMHSSRSSDDPLVEYDETRGYLVFDYSLR